MNQHVEYTQRLFGHELMCGHRISDRIANIVLPVLEREQVTWPMILSPQRGSALVVVRHEIWWTVRREAVLTFPQIGNIFNRCHSSIQYGVACHDAKLRGKTYVKPWIVRKDRRDALAAES